MIIKLWFYIVTEIDSDNADDSSDDDIGSLDIQMSVYTPRNRSEKQSEWNSV